MPSQTEIVSAALTHVGEAVDTGNPSFSLARLRFNSVRDRLLAETRWNFALKLVFLTPTESLTSLPSDTTFAYAYALPADLIRFLGVNDPQAPQENYGISSDIAWKVIGDEVWSDTVQENTAGEQGLFCWYVARIEDIDEWDPLFQEVMIYELALIIGAKGKGAAGTIQHLQRRRDELMSRAKVTNAQENTPETFDVQAGWLRARGGGSGYPFPSRGGNRLSSGPVSGGGLPSDVGAQADDIVKRNSHNVPVWGKLETNNVEDGAITRDKLASDARHDGHEVPAPPSSGTHVLMNEDGVLTWVAFPKP